ncbi:MAG TPA: retropepsin-like aspartic protease, partial [Brevundimonas sp.]|nr:retropepsin-like aspartic protease [Brevundimonas sp.]
GQRRQLLHRRRLDGALDSRQSLVFGGCQMKLLAAASVAVLSIFGDDPSSREEVLQGAEIAAPGDTAPLEAWLSAHAAATAAERRPVLTALCDAYGRVGRYRDAHQACASSAGDAPSTGLQQSIAFWATLAGEPPVSVTGAVDAPLTYGWSGLAELSTWVNGHDIAWAVDTGAEISVISDSQAERMGARLLDRPVGITGSTPGEAVGRLGMIDQIRVGSAEIRNMPVFVLPDAALTVPDKGPLPPILGMPAIYVFGSMTFREHGNRLQLGASENDGLAGSPLKWNPVGFEMVLDLPGGPIDVHLDSGANATELHDASARPLLSQAQQAALVSRSLTARGVSGAVVRETRQLDGLAVGIGGGVCQLGEVAFGDEQAGAQGRAGIDLVKGCDTLELNFRTMRVIAR